MGASTPIPPGTEKRKKDCYGGADQRRLADRAVTLPGTEGKTTRTSPCNPPPRQRGRKKEEENLQSHVWIVHRQRPVVNRPHSKSGFCLPISKPRKAHHPKKRKLRGGGTPWESLPGIRAALRLARRREKRAADVFRGRGGYSEACLRLKNPTEWQLLRRIVYRRVKCAASAGQWKKKKTGGTKERKMGDN